MIAQLEAELARAWTRANLSVYADYLQGQGDPRGEWIAMDLAALRDGLDAATQQQRAKLLQPFQAHGFIRYRYGFADAVYQRGFMIKPTPDRLRELLAKPLGRYLRRMTIVSKVKELERVMRVVGEAPRPWLERLTINIQESPWANDTRATVDISDHISTRTTRQLAKATPMLRVLDLCDRRLFYRELEHPKLPTGAISRTITHHPLLNKLEVTIADEPPQLLELGRVQRMHLGIVDELDHAQREAWAELEFAIEHSRDDFDEPLVEPEPFPGDAFDIVLATAVDVPLYGEDWRILRDHRAQHPDSAVRIRRL